MQLDGITLEEVRSFIGTLTNTEREYYSDIDANSICRRAVYIVGVKKENVLMGIGGIISVHGVAYNAFYVVKTAYQSRGVGTQIATAYRHFARVAKLPLLLLIVSGDNTPAMKILKKLGGKMSCVYNDKQYSYIAKGVYGNILGWLLPVIIPLYVRFNEK